MAKEKAKEVPYAPISSALYNQTHEAIDVIKCLAWHTRPSEEEIEQAIRTLEQEPREVTLLNRIKEARREIAEVGIVDWCTGTPFNRATVFQDEVLGILDKLIAEVEGHA